MSTLGSLTVVGLGPGPDRWLTPEVADVLASATDLVGYGPYLDRIPQSFHRRHGSDNRVELSRARLALDLAVSGRKVALVSGGDPGVFAMASALFEALESGDDPAWAGVPVRVCPGVSAMLAAAARVGAPLGHDFCVLSLSDNLKPWEVVLKRLRLAAEADFVIALYNPISKARPWQLGAALDTLRTMKDPGTPVVLARAVGRHDEDVTITTLADCDPATADMRTLVLIGSSQTRLLPRKGGGKGSDNLGDVWVYTPRSYYAAEVP
ncbi:precorrin-3B C(17)-methyltransferase [Nitrospirillum viridazoti]|uniref:Precorrin-3B C(17)-methyltransferase n=1 Tax=Nitrospirillum viridazoti CBAmc TaxID=1441467 RepID=A0A248K252_9PROT|nr:precorrin-3B C(17)-methyltransferase [Nitrospirillum amazonense]ASG25067.1 precorrin-3B C(17)-methyltransferase [Nitrospirillum amazonense CBAmc]TWB26169.1 precorrin-3B C17-methyltransferase [Nitrospirillum amazonense]